VTPVVRCGRRTVHLQHTYVANPRSTVDLQCPGRSKTRSVGQLLVEHPEYADLAQLGAVRHTLAVASA
jgi:hypothetical protein